MVGIYLGANPISMGAPVQEVYVGSTQVWPPLPTASFSELVLAKGCIGYWKMNQTVSTAACADSSVLGNTLSIDGGSFLVNQAPLMNENGSVQCSGGRYSSQLSTLGNWDTTPTFTVLAWLNLDINPVDSSHHFCQYGDSDLNNWAWQMLARPLNGERARLVTNNTSNITENFASVDNAIVPGVTTLCCITFSNATQTFKIWKDGVPFGTGAMTNPWKIPVGGRKYFSLGGRKGTTNGPWIGRMSNLAVLDYEPTDQEALDFYNAGKL